MKVIVGKHKIKIQKEIVNEKEINITKCKFEFDKDITQDFVKDIYFTLGDTTIKIANIQNNECNIPYEILNKNGMVELGVVAYLIENETEIKRYNPSPDYFDTYTGSIKENYENDEPITPTDKEQMEQAIQDIGVKMDNLDIDAEKVGTTATITITKKDGNTKQVEINDGEAGNGITSIEKTSTSGLVDTYTITYTNGTTTTYEVTNGEDGEVTQAQLDEVIAENDYLNSVIEQAFDEIDGTGTSITLNDTIQARIKTDLKGNTEQDSYTGKNKLPYPYTETTHTHNGITFIVNNDGSILVNGTATAQANIKLYGNHIESNQKEFTGQYLYGGTNNVNLRALNNTNNNYKVLATDTGSGAEINTSTYTKGYIELTVFNGVTVNNELIKPMVLNSLSDISYEPFVGGNASPNPDYPQNVNVVTGNNTITISNGDNTSSTSYPINLGLMELCKIGDYEDYIYKNNGNWYKKANVGKIVLDGSESQWRKGSATSFNRYAIGGTAGYTFVNIKQIKDSVVIKSTYFIGISQNNSDNGDIGISGLNAQGIMINFPLNNTSFDTLEKFKTWLSTHNTIVYYVLDTPTDIQITDTNLINQLNNLEKAISYKNQTNISQTNANLPFILDVTALGKLSS